MTSLEKRLFDLAISLPVCIICGPLVLALAVAVRMTSGGPGFYFHTRLGRGKKPIRVAKLRTMVDGAEHLGPEVTSACDPRVTRLGAFLRATKLDELPQFWNVLRGDMSIVGPRREAVRYAREYRPEWERVFTVRPGITDRASLVFRREESLLAGASDRELAYLKVILPAKMELTLAGIDNDSLRENLLVLGQTVLALLGRDVEHPVLKQVQQAIAKLEPPPNKGE